MTYVVPTMGQLGLQSGYLLVFVVVVLFKLLSAGPGPLDGSVELLDTSGQQELRTDQTAERRSELEPETQRGYSLSQAFFWALKHLETCRRVPSVDYFFQSQGN